MACFALNAVSFLAVLFALSGIVVPGAGRAAAATARRGSVLDGFHYLRTQPTLAGLVLLTLVLCVFGWPLITLLPAFTKIELGRSEQDLQPAGQCGRGRGAGRRAGHGDVWDGRRGAGSSW